ncbi:MAG TPA: YtxH domain-containing protein [Terriglobales bacterium]|jgi:gas vesicle protein
MAESRGLWFLVGLSVGALAGILYAPQTGEQTRDLLSRKADQGRDYVQRKSGDLRSQVGNWREQAGGFREQASAARDQAVQFADRGKQAVTRQIDQFQAAVEAGKQAYRESAGLKKDNPEADEASGANL